MELETINRLYLELSQISTATTAKEIKLKNGIHEAVLMVTELCYKIEQCGASDALTKCSVAAISLKTKLSTLLG